MKSTEHLSRTLACLDLFSSSSSSSAGTHMNTHTHSSVGTDCGLTVFVNDTGNLTDLREDKRGTHLVRNEREMRNEENDHKTAQPDGVAESSETRPAARVE